MVTGQRPVSVDDLAAALDLTSGGGSPIGGRPVKVDDLKLVLESMPVDVLYDGPATTSCTLKRSVKDYTYILCIGQCADWMPRIMLLEPDNILTGKVTNWWVPGTGGTVTVFITADPTGMTYECDDFRVVQMVGLKFEKVFQ